MQTITSDQSARVIIESLIAKVTDLEQVINNKDHIIMGLKKKKGSKNLRAARENIEAVREVIDQTKSA